MSETKSIPCRRRYLLAGLLALVGLAAPAAPIGYVIREALKPPSYVIVPGKGSLDLPEAGKYKICYEYRSVVGGKTYISPQAFPGLACRIVHADSGEEVPVESMFGSLTYTSSGHAGTGIWQFEIDQAGSYELTGWYPEGVTGPAEVVLAIDKAFPLVVLLVGIFAGGGIALICWILAGVLVVLTLIRRARAARTAAPAEAGAGG